MIARITTIAVAVSFWGLLTHVAPAQTKSADLQYPVTQTAFSSCDTDCTTHGGATGACDAATDTDLVTNCDQAACDGGTCDDDSVWNRWLSWKHLGLRHHPGCSCLRCRPRHTWASFDALLWWGKGRKVPVLASGGPNAILPGSEVLFGGGGIGNQLAAGARTDFGFWFDQCETLGIGATFWGLHGDRANYSADSSQQPTLGRPYFDVVSNAEDAIVVSWPGLVDGTMNVTTKSSVLGADAYLRSAMVAGRGYNIDLMGGYHFMRLDDEINIFSASTVLVGPSAGTTTNLLDYFNAKNEFHGGSVGVVGEFRHGKWTVTALTKLSVGNMRQTIRIDGYQSISGGPATPGGVLAQPSNIGTYTRDKTAWIPEFGLNGAYEVRSWLRLNVGYNIMWISDVVFSGDQIDRGVDLSPNPNPTRPAFDFRGSEYWLHGLNLGATITY